MTRLFHSTTLIAYSKPHMDINDRHLVTAHG
jgi:hypothetical protein